MKNARVQYEGKGSYAWQIGIEKFGDDSGSCILCCLQHLVFDAI